MKHILIVDDEQQMLNSLEFILMSGGYMTSAVPRAREAQNRIREALKTSNPVDLLITDIQMPEITGLQLIDELNRQGLAVPTLAITGYGDKEMVVELMRMGVKDFRDKPFDPEELLQQVKGLFERLEQEKSAEQELIACMEKEKAVLEERIERYLADIKQLKAKVTQVFGTEKAAPAKEVMPSVEEPVCEDGFFKVYTKNGQVVVTPAGDLKEDCAADFRTLLIGLLDQGHRSFRFDLGRVKLIDTMSFSIFLVFARTIMKKDTFTRLEICGASFELKNLFRLTHMDGVYHFTD